MKQGRQHRPAPRLLRGPSGEQDDVLLRRDKNSALTAQRKQFPRCVLPRFGVCCRSWVTSFPSCRRCVVRAEFVLEKQDVVLLAAWASQAAKKARRERLTRAAADQVEVAGRVGRGVLLAAFSGGHARRHFELKKRCTVRGRDTWRLRCHRVLPRIVELTSVPESLRPCFHCQRVRQKTTGTKRMPGAAIGVLVHGSHVDSERSCLETQRDTVMWRAHERKLSQNESVTKDRETHHVCTDTYW